MGNPIRCGWIIVLLGLYCFVVLAWWQYQMWALFALAGR